MDREPRVLRPDRKQLRLEPVDLDARISADHRARLVWAFVESLDLGPFYDRIESVEGHAGRPAIDPAVLLALWLYATIDGVGSARRLSRLCGAESEPWFPISPPSRRAPACVSAGP